MSQQIFDIDTVGFRDGNNLGNFFDFYVNNTFYLLAPEYYYSFYAIYLNRCLSAYDGWVGNFHNAKLGLVPQRMLQSITTGLNNMTFAHGIDFVGNKLSYDFAVNWAKKTKLYKGLKKAQKFGIAGGTGLFKLNRENKELYVSSHRIDTFFVDIDGSGEITSCRVFFDAIHNTNKQTKQKEHYGICEERYFNKEGRPCIKATVYKSGANLQTETQGRLNVNTERVPFESLPRNVARYIQKNYPSIVVDEEQYLPFPNSLGCYLWKFTDDIPQIPNTPFGQPIGDILFTENFQYDQMKYFEKNEVDLARARALIPEEFWNKDDPNYEETALNERFYQKVNGMISDNDKITPIQFLLRGTDMRTQMENIYRDCAFKLNVSASSIASFLSEGAGARTATEIISERTKSDTWIKGQINLNKDEVNRMLADVMYYYNREPVEIVFKAEDQSPYIERLKANSDVFSAGNMSPSLYVKQTFKNLTLKEQEDEIAYLTEKINLDRAMQYATLNQWQNNEQQSNQSQQEVDKKQEEEEKTNPKTTEGDYKPK